MMLFSSPQCPSFPPCAAVPPLFPPLPPPPVMAPQNPCQTACPPPVLPFLPPPPCQQTCGAGPPPPAPLPPVAPLPPPLPPISTISSTNYGGPFAYPQSIPSSSLVPPSPQFVPSTVLPETTLSTLPPLVPLPTPGYAQSIPSPLPPPPSLVPLTYQSPQSANLPPTFTETEPKPASPFQSAYVEELAPTLLPPPSQEYKTKYSKERVFFEGDSSSNSKEGLTEYDENEGAAPPSPPVGQVSGQVGVPYQLPGFIPTVQTAGAYPPSEEDDRIYAKDGEVKHSNGLTSSIEYNPYFDGAHPPSASAQQENFESFSKRNALLKRHKSAKQHSSNTIQKTTTTCNSEKLARVMAKAINGDVAVAKKLVQKATEVAFDGSKFDVFCANGEFSYSIHSRKYCEITKDEVTCFAFR
ncbi:unnamed protein product, partial [Mesorhabditis belari]|uniref:Ground-like domain-containing protein n=1 Tax=Mesorhabditis belari TaxID=2138241 RepID=A0AAF3EGB0_9BILA